MVPETDAFRLTTLGPIGLVGPDLAACARLLSQSKQLAILAYLATRPAGERVSRDRLLVTFWPEATARRAGGSLRTALHRLRRDLGADLIENEGARVGVSARRLVCDAAQLLGAAPGSASEAQLALYRGEFLDSLHVPGAPDFERWVDRSRAALRARVSDIAWSLSSSAEAAGEWITAARHARRAVELAVDVEGAAQRLIRLLDRAGDRAAAMAEFERLSSVLDREFGIPPSPETSALIAEVRRRSVVERGVDADVMVSEGERRPRSLAVLPFEDLSGGAGSYLANGLGEDLLTALSRIHGVRVISRTSVRRFAAQPPASMRSVREQLGVDLVVEGSVQVRESRCRITVQLIDARRDGHLWAETYDRSLDDVFEVQSDVALRIARELETELSPREHMRLRHPPTTNLRAWRLYLKGRELWGRRTARDTARAISLFERSLELDDRFAPAWAGLADARMARAAFGGGSLDEAVKRAKDAIRRALDIDPDSGEARASLGLFLTFNEPDPAGAEREYRRAVELSPGYASAHCWYGNWLCVYGRPEQGLAELAVAAELDPLSPVVSGSVGLGLLHLDRTADAESQFGHTLEMDPEYWRARFGLVACAAVRGDIRTAATELVRVWSAGAWGADPRDGRAAERLAGQNPEAVLEWLRRSAGSVEGAGSIRMVEIVLLMLLRRYNEVLALLEAGRHAPWLGLLMLYAPVLDPLAREIRFRGVMEDAGLLLPRWQRQE